MKLLMVGGWHWWWYMMENYSRILVIQLYCYFLCLSNLPQLSLPIHSCLIHLRSICIWKKYSNSFSILPHNLHVCPKQNTVHEHCSWDLFKYYLILISMISQVNFTPGVSAWTYNNNHSNFPNPLLIHEILIYYLFSYSLPSSCFKEL